MTDTKRPLAILITTLCTLTAFTTGCSSTDADETKSQETLSAEEKMDVTLINATGIPLGSVDFDDLEEGQEQTYTLPEVYDELLENDTGYSITLRNSAGCYQILPFDESYEIFYSEYPEVSLEDGSVVVLTPDYDPSMEIVFAPGTDQEEAKAAALASYDAFLEKNSGEEEISFDNDSSNESSDSEAWEEEDPADQKSEADQAAKKLGYESMEDMRLQEHPFIDSLDGSFKELEGYWYPDGDVNSLTYFSVENGNLRRYTFDPEQGDVLLEYPYIKKSIRDTYTLNTGEKFHIKSGSFLDREKLSIQFEDDETVYYWRAY